MQDYTKKQDKPKISKNVTVAAKDEFMSRRHLTVSFLTLHQFRCLKSGGHVQLDKNVYDEHKDILRKVS